MVTEWVHIYQRVYSLHLLLLCALFVQNLTLPPWLRCTGDECTCLLTQTQTHRPTDLATLTLLLWLFFLAWSRSVASQRPRLVMRITAVRARRGGGGLSCLYHVAFSWRRRQITAPLRVACAVADAHTRCNREHRGCASQRLRPRKGRVRFLLPGTESHSTTACVAVCGYNAQYIRRKSSVSTVSVCLCICTLYLYKGKSFTRAWPEIRKAIESHLMLRCLWTPFSLFLFHSIRFHTFRLRLGYVSHPI